MTKPANDNQPASKRHHNNRHVSHKEKVKRSKNCSEEVDVSPPSNAVEAEPIALDPEQKAFSKFTENHLHELNSMRHMVKQLKNDMKTMHIDMVDRKVTLKSLQHKVVDRDGKIVRLTEERDKLLEEYQQLHNEYNSFEQRYITLEVLYEKALVVISNEIGVLKEENEGLKLKQTKVIEEYEAKLKLGENAVTTVRDELGQKTEQVKELERTMEMKNEEFGKLQTALETVKLELEEKRQEKIDTYEAQIAALKVEAQEREERYENCCRQKNELEAEKNKTIQEQAFKIREIERFLVQPTNCVQPNAHEAIAAIVPPIGHNQNLISDSEVSAPHQGDQQNKPSSTPSSTSSFTIVNRRLAHTINRIAFGCSLDEGDDQVEDVYERFPSRLPPTQTVRRKRVQNHEETSQESDIFDRMKRQKN